MGGGEDDGIICLHGSFCHLSSLVFLSYIVICLLELEKRHFVSNKEVDLINIDSIVAGRSS